MNTLDKLDVLAKSKRKKKSLFKPSKRNAVPRKSGGRKDISKKGGGAKAALMRRIHKDPDIQKLLKKNPKYDIIVVRKVTAFAKVMVQAALAEPDVKISKEKMWEIAKDINTENYNPVQFQNDWEQFQEDMKNMGRSVDIQANDEDDFEAREQAKKELQLARKELIAAKKANDRAKVTSLRAKITQLEDSSTSQSQKDQHKKFDDWNKELERRKKVGGYD